MPSVVALALREEVGREKRRGDSGMGDQGVRGGERRGGGRFGDPSNGASATRRRAGDWGWLCSVFFFFLNWGMDLFRRRIGIF